MSVGTATPAPPVPLEDWHGGGSKWVVFERAANDIDAHLLTGVLNEAGIETYSVKDRSTPGAWLHGGSDPWAPVTVYVRKLQYEDGRIVLAELSLQHDSIAARAAHSVPHTGRTTVIVWWLAALALGLLFTGIALSLIEESLERCHGRLVCELDS